MTSDKMENSPVPLQTETPQGFGFRPLYRQVKDALPTGAKLGDYIISVNMTAVKAK